MVERLSEGRIDRELLLTFFKGTLSFLQAFLWAYPHGSWCGTFCNAIRLSGWAPTAAPAMWRTILSFVASTGRSCGTLHHLRWKRQPCLLHQMWSRPKLMKTWNGTRKKPLLFPHFRNSDEVRWILAVVNKGCLQWFTAWGLYPKESRDAQLFWLNSFIWSVFWETHLDTCELDSINQYPHERSKTLYVATISNKIRDKFVELLKVSNFSIRVERAIVHCPASCCVFYSVERGSWFCLNDCKLSSIPLLIQLSPF